MASSAEVEIVSTRKPTRHCHQSTRTIVKTLNAIEDIFVSEEIVLTKVLNSGAVKPLTAKKDSLVTMECAFQMGSINIMRVTAMIDVEKMKLACQATDAYRLIPKLRTYVITLIAANIKSVHLESAFHRISKKVVMTKNVKEMTNATMDTVSMTL